MTIGNVLSEFFILMYLFLSDFTLLLFVSLKSRYLNYIVFIHTVRVADVDLLLKTPID